MPSGKALKGIQRYLAHGMRPTATMWITPVCLSASLSGRLSDCLAVCFLASFLSFCHIPAYDHPLVWLPACLFAYINPDQPTTNFTN
jgi:hypothetical protein